MLCLSDNRLVRSLRKNSARLSHTRDANWSYVCINRINVVISTQGETGRFAD